jgi:hypothetical protein
VVATLDILAAVTLEQGKLADADSFFEKALSIRGETLGPEHPEVAASLESYAALLRKANRQEKAAELEARARSTHTKHAEQPTKQ